jgi:drug/metabolite transporter (DMT)-like permease
LAEIEEETTMSVPAAYLGVVLIWATTPLAIQWSSEGVGPWLGVSARMLVGVFVCLVLVALLSRRMRWHRKARHTYLAAGLGIWGAMSSVYWGAQFVPSGLVSVMFGLNPVVTGLLSGVILGERLGLIRALGMGLGVLGLSVVFANSLQLDPAQLPGLAAVLLSVLLHSTSAVWVKRVDAGLHPLETATGALLVAVPLFWLSWALGDNPVWVSPSGRTLWAILYLGVCATSIGFVLYYYLLREISASAAALITLVTPVLALLLGARLNHERVGAGELLGTGLILLGLAVFQWRGRSVPALLLRR